MPNRLPLLVMGCAAGGGLFAILAQQTAAPSLIVQVRDAVTSQPVPDATVRLFGSLVLEVGPGAFSSAGLTLERPPAPADVADSVTDARGRAEFTGIKPGSYTVEVRKPGWTSANTAAFSPIAQKRVRISAEPAGEQITFQLTRAARITGVAVDAETREPIPGLRLMSWRFHYQRGVRVPFTSGGWATTGPGGSFALDNLMPGEYLLQVLPQKLGQKRVRLEWAAGEARRVDTDFADRYWPGGVDAVAAVPLVVRAGEEVDAGRIVAARTSHYRILVRLTGADCRADDKVRLQTRPVEWTAVHSLGEFPCRGEYLVEGFEPGMYGLRAILDGPGRSLTGSAQVEVRRENPVAAIHLQPGVELQARVVMPDGVASPAKAVLRLSLSTVVGGGARFVSPPVGPGAGVSMAGVALEDQELRIFGVPVGYALREIRYNGSRIPDRILRLNPYAPTHVIELVLDDKPGLIAGSVRDRDRPVASAHVVLVRWPLEGNIYTAVLQTSGDEQGNFRFEALPAGEYAVAAIDVALAGKLEEPHVLQRLLSGAAKFLLAAGQSRTVTLRISEPGH